MSCGTLNTTEIGWICETVTSPVASEARTSVPSWATSAALPPTEDKG